MPLDCGSERCGFNPRRSPLTLAERFWRFVDRSGGPDACWPWLGRKDAGYGRFNVGGGKKVTAHRFAYELMRGPIPAGKDLLHSCLTRCCNPAHLRPGTDLENKADAVALGRHAYGERHGHAKLTEAGALAVFSGLRAGARVTDIAAVVGISVSAVCDIKRGRSWRHLRDRVAA